MLKMVKGGYLRPVNTLQIVDVEKRTGLMGIQDKVNILVKIDKLVYQDETAGLYLELQATRQSKLGHALASSFSHSST